MSKSSTSHYEFPFIDLQFHYTFISQALTLNEALNIDTANSQAMLSAGPDRGEERAAPDLPPSYNMATPLNERELMALLMASPLYQKLENIRKTFEKGNGGSAEGKESTKSMFY